MKYNNYDFANIVKEKINQFNIFFKKIFQKYLENLSTKLLKDYIKILQI